MDTPTNGDVIELKAQYTNLHEKLSDMDRENKLSFTRQTEELSGIRADMIKRNEGNVSVFATKDEVAKMKIEFSKALEDAMAPIKKLAWLILGAFVMGSIGVVFTVASSMVVFYLTDK